MPTIAEEPDMASFDVNELIEPSAMALVGAAADNTLANVPADLGQQQLNQRRYTCPAHPDTEYVHVFNFPLAADLSLTSRS